MEGNDAAYSWHTLPELWKCLHMVQTYLERRPRANSSQLPPLPADRKRKAPDQDPSSRDVRPPHLFTRNGLLTPDGRSRSPSIASSSNTKTSDDTTTGEPRFYGVSLQKKEGYLVPHKLKNNTTPPLKRLPTEWRDTAAYTPVDQADQYIRAKFVDMLRPVGNCHLQNDVDNSTPSLDFTFVDRYVFRNGIKEQALGFVEGCQYPCRPNMGGHCGCEYTKLCTCLEFGAVDEVALEAKDPELFQRYKEAEKNKEPFDTIALPKRFPYSRKAKDAGSRPQTLVHKYLNSRNPIYECNPKCNCGPVCKSRLVQKGRKVPLTIFKTPDRGWGVFCNEDLVTGEFVDTYLGEVIDFEEAEQREQEVGEIKNSYMYTLDKFVGDIDATGKEIQTQDCHVVSFILTSRSLFIFIVTDAVCRSMASTWARPLASSTTRANRISANAPSTTTRTISTSTNLPSSQSEIFQPAQS